MLLAHILPSTPYFIVKPCAYRDSWQLGCVAELDAELGNGEHRRETEWAQMPNKPSPNLKPHFCSFHNRHGIGLQFWALSNRS